MSIINSLVLHPSYETTLFWVFLIWTFAGSFAIAGIALQYLQGYLVEGTIEHHDAKQYTWWVGFIAFVLFMVGFAVATHLN